MGNNTRKRMKKKKKKNNTVSDNTDNDFNNHNTHESDLVFTNLDFWKNTPIRKGTGLPVAVDNAPSIGILQTTASVLVSDKVFKDIAVIKDTILSVKNKDSLDQWLQSMAIYCNKYPFEWYSILLLKIDEKANRL